MNREEAIECLSERVSIGGTGEQNCMVVFGVNTDTLDEAFDMAISAIRQQEHFREVTKKAGPLTNAQKIRAMTDEELVNFLMRLMGHAQCFAEGIFHYHPCPQEQNCKQCGIDWLQQPAEEDGHDERKENEHV